MKMIMRRGYRKSKKNGPVRANKVTFDGIKFASGLEKYQMPNQVSHQEGNMDLEIQLLEAWLINLYHDQTLVMLNMEQH